MMAFPRSAALALTAALVLAVIAWGFGAAAAPSDDAPAGGEGKRAPLDSGTATRTFREANGLYAQGDYDGAAALYEEIVASGFENADVQYNLANAHYKAGRRGPAVLGYERALRLDPAHENASFNLDFVRRQLEDKQGRVASGPFVSALERVYGRLDAATCASGASVFYFLLCAVLIAAILKGLLGPWLRRVATVLAVLLVVSGALAGVKIYGVAGLRDAIVLAREVDVRTGPGDEFVLEFKLHEGTKVHVEEVRGDWMRICVSGTRLEGWLPARVVEEIS